MLVIENEQITKCSSMRNALIASLRSQSVLCATTSSKPYTLREREHSTSDVGIEVKNNTQSGTMWCTNDLGRLLDREEILGECCFRLQGFKVTRLHREATRGYIYVNIN